MFCFDSKLLIQWLEVVEIFCEEIKSLDFEQSLNLDFIKSYSRKESVEVSSECTHSLEESF